MKIPKFILNVFIKNEHNAHKGFSLSPRRTQAGQTSPADTQEQNKSNFKRHKSDISPSLSKNLERLKQEFNVPPNKDLIIREFVIPGNHPLKASVVFMEGLAARDIINNNILTPLMLISNLETHQQTSNPLQPVKDYLLPTNQVEEKDVFAELVDGLLTGSALVLIDRHPRGLLVETKGWEHRTVARPFTENVIQGPQDAFVEHIRVNTALIRRRIKNNRLVTEMLKLGRLSHTDCAIMYVKGLTNTSLVAEVKDRIQSIDTDYLTDSGTLAQFIEDNPFSIVPGQTTTERPDRAGAALAEGHVCVIVDGDPNVLILPVTLWTHLQTAEDIYIRWPYSYILRLVRVFALLLNLILPAFYISVVNFHPEMIPTDLLISIATSRETVPFSALEEIVVMEISFELIREAGIRVPGLLGNTIGIVGALILGQAAVAASIISPLLVIVVALTGLGSFAIPSYSLSLSVRLFRFILLLLSGFLGFFGLGVGIHMLLIHMCGQKSFGIPILAPKAPVGPSSDVIYRRPIFRQEFRPFFMRTQDARRQKHITRPWDPLVGGEDDGSN